MDKSDLKTFFPKYIKQQSKQGLYNIVILWLMVICVLHLCFAGHGATSTETA
jgi:hypothetical protein